MSDVSKESETDLRAFDLESAPYAELSRSELAEVIGGAYLRALTSASPTSTSQVCTCPKRCCGSSYMMHVAPSVYGR